VLGPCRWLRFYQVFQTQERPEPIETDRPSRMPGFETELWCDRAIEENAFADGS
jgi:hypothetical protein